MKTYKYTCVICNDREHISWAERKTPFVCRGCRDIRDAKIRKERTNDGNIKKRLIRERGDVCEVCKNNKATILHHILEIANGGTSIDSNLLLVCLDCHTEIHSSDRPAWQAWKLIGGTK